MPAATSIYDRIWALARNLWWSWQPDVTSLFRELDPLQWRAVDHNPIRLLAEFPVERLEQVAADLALHSRINYAYRRLQEYLSSTTTWGATHAGVLGHRPAAYFSAEFGLHESLPIYSGGLGVLAGDHLKSASDLGIPLVGVGLFYDQGYFNQRLDEHGWQREEYFNLDVSQLPMEPALGPGGQPVTVSIDTRDGTLKARVWRLQVGRNPLFLLDSDVEGNREEDRQLTARLYGGDQRVRIRQEVLLGVGGIRALHALGIKPGVIHLNEGHSAFAGLEVIRRRMHDDGLSFHEALREVAYGTVFTTHTPVPAGHDRFSGDLIEEHLGPLRDSIGLSREELLSLGRVEPQNPNEPFCMTVLALKLSRRANAVSALHGIVTRRMWAGLWPWRSEEEVPIGHITNGVHVHTWLAAQMRALYDRHLSPNWDRRTGQPEVWAGIENVDPGELWETHQTLKQRLLTFTRRRISEQAQRRGEPDHAVERARRALDPNALTIGFARRFAPYKRGSLVFRDLNRIANLVNDPERPVQFIFAGEAHPANDEGKVIIQEVVRVAQDPRFNGKVVFIEDYDINVGRFLVQGADVWLNNPRRPLEASGTSGQKCVLNGGLNCSVLDGWWAEAFDGSNGFAISDGDVHSNDAIQDARDSAALLDVLEKQVIPLFYRRDRDGLPQLWIERMKRAIRTLGWRFNADRMVMDYVRRMYVPAAGGLSCDQSVR